MNLDRKIKACLVMLADGAGCAATVVVCFEMAHDGSASRSFPGLQIAVACALALSTAYFFDLYRTINRYSKMHYVQQMLLSFVAYGFIYAFVLFGTDLFSEASVVEAMQPGLLFIWALSTRLFARAAYNYRTRTLNGHKNVLIFGAGDAGSQLANAVDDLPDITICGFLDDDRRLIGCRINGLQVYGTNSIGSLINRKKIKEILFAIPSLDSTTRRQKIRSLSAWGIPVRVLPGVADLARGSVSIADLQQPELAELLGRESAVPETELLKKAIAENTLLVTGAGGSIGSEICRQSIKYKPHTLLLVDSSEFALYQIEQELVSLGVDSEVNIVPLLLSITDQKAMGEVLSKWQPDFVFHAAAYKHVPLTEHNVLATIKNNIFGTLSLVKSAYETNVSNFVLVSTDKAVRPTNLMGASKRIAEMLVQSFAKQTRRTKFSIVRFGNVLGSSGSVVPLFAQQISRGGPVTITDPDITRFFMTISEAAQLVVQAGAMSSGGEMFVLKMGEPVKIITLARKMIAQAGYSEKNAENPHGDIEIVFSGLRPGEKLYEELVIEGAVSDTTHAKILKVNEPCMEFDKLQSDIESLEDLVAQNLTCEAHKLVQLMVPQYKRNMPISDWRSKKDRG